MDVVQGRCSEDKKSPKIYSIERKVCEVLQIRLDPGSKKLAMMRNAIDEEIKKYKKFMSNPSKKRAGVVPDANFVLFEESDDEDETMEIDENKNIEEDTWRKPFNQLGRRMQYTRTDPLIAELQKFVDKDNSLCTIEDPPLILRKLLGILI